MKQIYISGYFKDFKRLNKYSLLKSYPKAEIIKYRLQIIEFFNKYGATATKDAFNVARSTVYLWKKS